jgi:small conductance mechanosensitive channel
MKGDSSNRGRVQQDARRGYDGGVLGPLLAIDIDTDRAIEDALTHGGRIVLIGIIAFVAITLISRLIGPVVRVAIREQMQGEAPREVEQRVETLSNVIYRTTVVAVAAIAFLMVLPEFGLEIGPLIAGVGILALAVSLGAQSLVKDVITGIFILIENQYARGDVVTIAGLTGQVEDINLRRTVLRDLDGVVHFVPHAEIKTTSNQTKGFSRVNLIVSVPYTADIDKTFEVINGVGEEMARDGEWGPRIREAPRALRVDKLGDSAIDIRVLGVTEPMEQWPVKGELRRRLRIAFEREGIRPAQLRDDAAASAPPPAPPQP